jgi:hypothetical protein
MQNISGLLFFTMDVSFIENIDALIACCASHYRYAPMVELINFSSTKKSHIKPPTISLKV